MSTVIFGKVNVALASSLTEKLLSTTVAQVHVTPDSTTTK